MQNKTWFFLWGLSLKQKLLLNLNLYKSILIGYEKKYYCKHLNSAWELFGKKQTDMIMYYFLNGLSPPSHIIALVFKMQLT